MTVSTETPLLHLTEGTGENVISSHQKLNTSDEVELTIYAQYHQSEIDQNKRIHGVARGIIWAGFGVIVFGIILSIFGLTTSAIVAAASGVITEFISGSVFVFMMKSTKSKMDYYKQLSFDEECSKYIKAFSNLSEDKKVEMLNKLIDNYCARRK